MNSLLPWLFVAFGVFSAFGAISNLELLFGGPRPSLFVRILGRSGARVFYAIGGLVLITIGVLVMTGVFLLR